MSKIITRHVFPPIPDRRFDWVAYHDGEEESGHNGWGATEQKAIEDLRRLDQERAEAEEAWLDALGDSRLPQDEDLHVY